MDRREKVLHGLDLKRSVGLEIGPLANPMVRKSDGTVLYVDYVDAPALRLGVSDFLCVRRFCFCADRGRDQGRASVKRSS